MGTPPDTRTRPLPVALWEPHRPHSQVKATPITPSLQSQSPPWHAHCVSSNRSQNKLPFKLLLIGYVAMTESSGASSVQLTEGTVLAFGMSLLMGHVVHLE